MLLEANVCDFRISAETYLWPFSVDPRAEMGSGSVTWARK